MRGVVLKEAGLSGKRWLAPHPVLDARQGEGGGSSCSMASSGSILIEACSSAAIAAAIAASSASVAVVSSRHGPDSKWPAGLARLRALQREEDVARQRFPQVVRGELIAAGVEPADRDSTPRRELVQDELGVPLHVYGRSRPQSAVLPLA